MHLIKKWSGLALILVVTGCTVLPQMDMPICQENCAPFGVATAVGRISNTEIDEASGMAGSIRHPGVLWVHNDSGGAARLFAISHTGKTLGQVRFPGLRNLDWEDVTSFRFDGKPYLAIADIGDNFAVRKAPSIHIVEEPDFGKPAPRAQVAWSIPYEYEDGARDCESIAIDVENERVLLLTKRDVLPVLYELPLRPSGRKSVARRLVEVPLPQPSDELKRIKNRKGLYSAQPTAMDISDDGTQAAVLTYRNAYFFAREEDSSWEQAFTRAPKVIALPPMDSGEALAFATSGEIFVTAERHPAPLVRVQPR
ncbi:MAG: hypothetical protein AAF438_06635 [Pseudomonadota bacterium]